MVEVGEYTIRNDIWHATDFGKRNIILDVTWMSAEMSWTLLRVMRHINIEKNGKKIDNLLVVRNDFIIKIK